MEFEELKPFKQPESNHFQPRSEGGCSKNEDVQTCVDSKTRLFISIRKFLRTLNCKLSGGEASLRLKLDIYCWTIVLGWVEPAL